MNQDDVRTLIAVAGAVLATFGLTWSIASWRMAGPSLRFHCFWYREVLVIRVFNAGRTADTVEQMDLGTRPRESLTKLLELPLRVESGQSKEWKIGADYLAEERKAALAGGWVSMWSLAGSMRQQRNDVVPVDMQAPSSTGWRLVPRRARWWRCVPLATSMAAFLATEPAWANLVAGFAVVALFAWGAARLGTLSRPRFRRARMQRWVTAASLMLALVGGAVTAREHEAPIWHIAGSIALMGAGMLLASPRAGEGLLAGRRQRRRRLVTTTAAATSDPSPPTSAVQ